MINPEQIHQYHEQESSAAVGYIVAGFIFMLSSVVMFIAALITNEIAAQASSDPDFIAIATYVLLGLLGIGGAWFMFNKAIEVHNSDVIKLEPGTYHVKVKDVTVTRKDGRIHVRTEYEYE